MQINKIRIGSKCDLKSIEISLVEVFNVNAGITSAVSGANVGVHQTTPDPFPIFSIGDTFLQPIGVIADMILLIPSIGYNLAGATVSDGECEDCERESEENEKEHREQVKPEEARDTATSADETCDRDEHKEDSENHDWFVEETFALGSCIFAEPDPGGENWD